MHLVPRPRMKGVIKATGYRKDNKMRQIFMNQLLGFVLALGLRPRWLRSSLPRRRMTHS